MATPQIGLQAVFDTTAFKKGIQDYSSKLDAATNQTTSAGAKLGGILAATAATAATAFAAIAAAAAAAAIGVVAGITKMVFAASTLGDKYSQMSLITGIATEKLQEWQYAGKLLDVDLETFSSSMRFLTKNMYAAKDGSGDTAAAFKSLGIQITDGGGQLRDANTVFMEMIDALGKVENPTERDAIAMKTMGKAAMELNPLILAGSKTLQKYSEEAHRMGAVIGDEGIQALDQFRDKWDALGVSFTSIKAQLALSVLPIFQKLEDWMMGFVANTLVPAIQHFSTFIQILTGASPEIANAANTISTVQAAPKGWKLLGTMGSRDLRKVWENPTTGERHIGTESGWAGGGTDYEAMVRKMEGVGYGNAGAAAFEETPFEQMIRRIYETLNKPETWTKIQNTVTSWGDYITSIDWESAGNNVLHIIGVLETVVNGIADIDAKVKEFWGYITFSGISAHNLFEPGGIPAGRNVPGGGATIVSRGTVPVTSSSYARPPSVQVLTGGHAAGMNVTINANIANGLDAVKIATQTADIIRRRSGPR